MNYEAIDNLKKAVSALGGLRAKLDPECCEEWEDNWDENHPYLAIVAKKAADFGHVRAMHLYAILLKDESFKLKAQGKNYLEKRRLATTYMKDAALGGCPGAMEDINEYANQLEATNIEQIAFLLLSGESNLDGFVQYWKDNVVPTITDEEVSEGRKLFEQFQKQMESNGIIKQRYCQCIFP